MKHISPLSLVLLAGAVLTMLAASSPEFGRAGEARTETPPALTVHEWGTFTSVSDSTGARLQFYANDRDLPDFIYESSRLKGEKPIFVSMETPVLYFYSERELTASVSVDFPKGRMTEWYPQADQTRTGGLRWQNVRIVPKAKVDLPYKPGDGSRYYAARETDAAPLYLTVTKDRQEKKEWEKLLFYRGVGDCATPLTVRALGGGKYVVRNTGKEKITDCFLIRISGGKLRFQECGSLEAAGEENIAEPAQDAGVAELSAAVVRALTAQGLYEKEARAMVKTWRPAWFGEEGTRFLYLMPAATTNQVLPLHIQPKPAALVRVLVGRQDVLTPEREREVDGLIQRLHESRSESEQQVLRREVERQFGRFAMAATEAAEARITQRERR